MNERNEIKRKYLAKSILPFFQNLQHRTIIRLHSVLVLPDRHQFFSYLFKYSDFRNALKCRFKFRLH